MKKSRKFRIHHIIATITTVLVVIFILQNSEMVTINFLFWNIMVPRILLIIIILLTGFLLGYLAHSFKKK